MPLLSFSVCKDELLNHTKTDTTRVLTFHRYQEICNAWIRGSPIYVWWKPRTKEKEHLFDSKVYNYQIVGFIQGPSGLWPWFGYIDTKDAVPGFTPDRAMTYEEVQDYVRREGFETLAQFVNVLKGKDSKRAGGSIEGKPMLRIRFWDGGQ
jgi:hypothetical protein